MYEEPSKHRKEAAVLSQQGNGKTKGKIGLTCRICQKKGHFSYELKYPAPIPQYEAVVHLNVEYNAQEYNPGLHLLNLMEENPNVSINASMSGDDYYPVNTNNEDFLDNSINKESDHTLLFIHNHTFFQKGYSNPNWILLHTESSIHVIHKTSLLKNIHGLDNMTKINLYSGVFTVTHKGTLSGYGLAWFNRDDIANILSMAKATKKYLIYYGNSAGDNFIL